MTGESKVDHIATAEGQVRVEQIGGNTYLSLNTSGTSGTEKVIRIDGLVTVTGADVIL